MYKEIKEILAKAKEDNVDIGVAYDKLPKTDERKKAFSFLQENQVAILKLHNAGRDEELKVLCNMGLAGVSVWKYIDALYSEGVIER